MERQVANFSRLNAKVLEGLRRRVDLLVDEFPFNLVRRESRPPDELVQVVSSRLEKYFGNVDVAALLNDFTVDKLSNLGRRILLRTIQLEGLRSSVVVV
jgi:hypothetical protein